MIVDFLFIQASIKMSGIIVPIVILIPMISRPSTVLTATLMHTIRIREMKVVIGAIRMERNDFDFHFKIKPG